MVSVEYEVACQTIGQLIAHQVALIASEEMKSEPDHERLQTALAARMQLVATREALEPSDDQAISSAILHYGPIAKRLIG